MDAGGACRVQCEGKIKEGPNLLERHTLRFEAAEGCVKREWRQGGLIKVERKYRNEQRRSVLKEL